MARPETSRRVRRRARLVALGAGAVLAVLAAGVRAATPRPPVATQIQIENFAFSPATLEIAAGATVSWVNRDEELHAVTSIEGGFRSPGIDDDEAFSHRFEKPGTYEYRCPLHPQMHGTVVVH